MKDARSARRLLREAGFVVSQRAFEANTLFDTPDLTLRTSSRLLRIREAGGGDHTYKGAPEPADTRAGEELELEIDNAAAMMAIVEQMGYRRVFRYEKYRTEFHQPRRAGIAMLDETPVGVYLELEGTPPWIDRTARRLGFQESGLHHRELWARLPGMVRCPRREELTDLVEMEVRELLSKYQFPGDDVPVIRGSALGALNGEPKWEAQIDALMDAVDTYVPLPTRAVDLPFLMPIEDIFSISGRGTVVTGRIERGKVKVGEACEIVGFRETRQTVCTGVEMFKKQLDEGMAGDNAGILLRGIPKEDVERGMVLAKPGSITPHTSFKGSVYVLSKEEGGRHTPFFKGYRPQFYFRTTDVTGVAELPEGVEMVMPGDNVELAVELITPVALEKGLRFAIREGGRTVGAGTVSEITK